MGAPADPLRDAISVAAAIAGGALTQAEAMRRARTRLKAVARLGAVSWLAPEAADLPRGAATGPFAGVPMLVKDLGGPRGAALPAADLWAALEAMAPAACALWRLFDDVDVVLLPMLSTAPPPLGAFPTDHRDPEAQLARMDAFAPYAALANVTGAPALTLPFGADADSLPLPIQMIDPIGGDLRLLALGAALERDGRWTHPIPLFGNDA